LILVRLGFLLTPFLGIHGMPWWVLLANGITAKLNLAVGYLGMGLKAVQMAGSRASEATVLIIMSYSARGTVHI
jgi:hypothetical protein